MTKGIKKDINKWKILYVHFDWHVHSSQIKSPDWMQSQSKSQQFCEYWQINSNAYMERKKSKNTNTILKNNRSRKTDTTWYQDLHKAMIIKLVWYWWEQMKQQNRIQNPHKYSHLPLDKEAKDNSREKDWSVQQKVLYQLDIQIQKKAVSSHIPRTFQKKITHNGSQTM